MCSDPSQLDFSTLSDTQSQLFVSKIAILIIATRSEMTKLSQIISFFFT